MNWMGGARNRVKYQGERRIQQEFFERQKLAAAQSFSRKTPAQKKRGLSQDLIALHTVSRVHSGVSDGTKRRPIKKVDLEKFQSCTRQIDEVDIGPCSPSQTPSKLLLSDGRLEQKSGFVKSTNADPTLSRELFPREKHIHRNCIHEKRYKDNADSEQEEQSLKNSSKTINITGENKDKPANANIIHKQPNEFSFSKPKSDGHHVKNAVKTKFDPYVSEDFQVTPLVRYTKKRSPENIEFDKSKKKKHSVGTIIRKDNASGTTETKRNHCLNEPCFSSTPITDVHSVKSDKNKNLEHFGGISPIIKGTAFSKDVESGFRFKPRPMVETKKGSKFSTSQCVVQERNIQESGKELFNPDPCCGLSRQGNESLGREVYEYNHGKLRKSCQLKHTKDPTNVTNQRLTSQIEQFDSSKYDLTENMFDNSLSRKSLVQGAEEEISGALAKYRNIFRHKNDQESPILQGHIDPVKTQNDGNKIQADNRSKIRISKPKFSDVEEEFQYKPMKAWSVKITPKIMNMYQKFDNGKETEIGTGSRNNYMEVPSRLSYHSVQRIPSPVPADEFPEHLLSPSKQLQDEIDQKLLEIIADERKNGLGTFIGRQIESNLQVNGASSYKPLKTGMSDVLNEMSQLEEDNSTSPDVPLEQTLKSTTNESAGAVTTESFEADAYLESEEMLLNADIEYMQDLGVMSNIETLIAAKKDSIVTGCDTENVEANRSKDEVEVENKTDVTLGKKLEADTDMDVTVDRALDACLENYEMIDKSDSGNINHNNSSQGNDVKSQGMETRNTKEQGNKVSRDISKDDEKKNVPDINGKNNDGGSKDIDSKLNTVEEVKCFENNSTNVEMSFVADKSETIGTGKTAQLQVPEISSGKNQFTQTVAKSSPQKSYVEVATSPFHELNTVQAHSDFGVQCDLTLFPTLSCLAGKCFKVKPVSNSTSSLHKTAEEGDVSNKTD